MSSLAVTAISAQNFYNMAENETHNTAKKFENSAFSQPCCGQWLGQSKSQLLQDLQDKNLPSISFASWLAVPQLGILIKFHHQICRNIDYY